MIFYIHFSFLFMRNYAAHCHAIDKNDLQLLAAPHLLINIIAKCRISNAPIFLYINLSSAKGLLPAAIFARA